MIPEGGVIAGDMQLRDPGFGPWFLGYEVLRDVEAHCANEAGKWRIGGRRGKGKFCANL